MREILTSGLMSGDGKRATASRSRTAPVLDSTTAPVLDSTQHPALICAKRASASLRLVSVLDVSVEVRLRGLRLRAWYPHTFGCVKLRAW